MSDLVLSKFAIDITGQVFGKLVVVHDLQSKTGSKRSNGNAGANAAEPHSFGPMISGGAG